MAQGDRREGMEGFRGCTTQSQRVLIQRYSMVGVEINLACKIFNCVGLNCSVYFLLKRFVFLKQVEFYCISNLFQFLIDYFCYLSRIPSF